MLVHIPLDLLMETNQEEIIYRKCSLGIHLTSPFVHIYTDGREQSGLASIDQPTTSAKKQKTIF